MRVITLTTDFGTRDSFVGAMKGVIAGLAPDVHIIDLTHDIPAGDVRRGAFALATAAKYFPEGTVHLAVVDPGVGSERRPIAARTRSAYWVGPDNGLLSWAVREQDDVVVRVLSNRTWWRSGEPSRTFHGRDIFAPVAARLAAGAAFDACGEVVTDVVRLPWPEPACHARSCAGEVVYVDHFGNAITNLPRDLLPAEAVARDTVRFHLPGGRTVPFGDCYAATAPGSTIAVAGSSGFIEIAVNRGDAARTLDLAPGSPVVAVW